jgi:hypothetical protein
MQKVDIIIINMLPKQESILGQTLQVPVEKKLVPERFQLKKKLGQGTFSKDHHEKHFI